MKVEVAPRRVDVAAGVSVPVLVTIVNDRDVIAGYAVRVLGADPSWLTMDDAQVSLFPGETRVVVASLTLPAELPAGSTTIAVQVRELTPPDDTSITDIELVVPARPAVQAQLDPVAVTAGRRATFSLLVQNVGNTVLHARPAGDDPEGKVGFRFDPPALTLPPGDHAIVDVRVSARQPLLGAPTVRVIGLHLDDVPPPTMLDVARDAPLPPLPDAPVRNDDPPVALGTFVQKPLVSRGSVSLVGLLAAVTVFALVLTVALSRLVGASAADRDLALAVAQAGQGAGGQGTSALAGTVTQLTTKQPLGAVSVGVYAADSTDSAVATAATDAKGAFQVPELAAGTYKVAFRAAGYSPIWFPGVAGVADATTVTLAAGEQRSDVSVAIGGVPASIAGTVVGADVGAATLYLETVADPSLPTPPVLDTDAGNAGVPTSATQPATRAIPLAAGAAVVSSVPIGTDGSFTLTNVPSPSVYDLVVAKTGYATAIQRVDVGAGEDRTGVEIALTVGDGSIAGTVTSAASGPLAGVTITATSGQSTSGTVSLTESPVGSFTLRRLPTPATVTVVAALEGYNTATQVVTLTQGQQLTGLSLVLTQASGQMTGRVLAVVDPSSPTPTPASGVSVMVTNGSTTVQTVTQNGQAAGSWRAGGLPVPGTYTVTFSRSDLSSQTVSVSLDATGAIGAQAQGATVNASGIQVTLRAATATVFGVVTQTPVGGGTAVRLPEATVTLTSGSNTYTVRTASLPAASAGAYSASGLRPGSYTISVGVASTAVFVATATLTAGQLLEQDATLDPPATVTVKVVNTGTASLVGYVVTLYRTDQYPSVPLDSQTVTGPTPPTTPPTTTTFDFGARDAPQSYTADLRPGPGLDPVGAVTFLLQPSANTPQTIQVQVDSP